MFTTTASEVRVDDAQIRGDLDELMLLRDSVDLLPHNLFLGIEVILYEPGSSKIIVISPISRIEIDGVCRRIEYPDWEGNVYEITLQDSSAVNHAVGKFGTIWLFDQSLIETREPEATALPYPYRNKTFGFPNIAVIAPHSMRTRDKDHRYDKGGMIDQLVRNASLLGEVSRRGWQNGNSMDPAFKNDASYVEFQNLINETLGLLIPTEYLKQFFTRSTLAEAYALLVVNECKAKRGLEVEYEDMEVNVADPIALAAISPRVGAAIIVKAIKKELGSLGHKSMKDYLLQWE